MKKLLNIALTAMLAVAFAACEDDPFRGIPVENPQQPVMPADGVQAVDIIADGGSANLEAAKTLGFIDVLSITRLENFPADQTLKIIMNVSATQDMAASQAIELTITEATDGLALAKAQAPAQKWDEAFKALVSRDPSAKTMYADYIAYAVQGSTSVLLGSVGTAQAISVTPFAPERIIETTYYVYGSISDGTIANAVALSHEGNQYDNPVFKTKVDITSDQIADGGWRFKVIPQSTKSAGQTWQQNHTLTFIGAGDEEGTLAYSSATADADWVIITRPGSYMLNVNIYEMTYSLTNAIEYIYVPGSNNDWGSWSTKLFTTDYINYTGFANLTGEFKFTGTNGWNNDLGNYGAGATNYDLLNGSNSNFTVDGTPGLYKLNVNLAGLTYTKNLIETISVVGSHNGWDAANAPKLTPSDDNLVWEGDINLSDNDEWKFNMNGNWDINLGGAEDDLQFNGDNLRSPGTGTFHIVLDLSALPYQCFIEQQ